MLKIWARNPQIPTNSRGVMTSQAILVYLWLKFCFTGPHNVNLKMPFYSNLQFLVFMQVVIPLG